MQNLTFYWAVGLGFVALGGMFLTQQSTNRELRAALSDVRKVAVRERDERAASEPRIAFDLAKAAIERNLARASDTMPTPPPAAPEEARAESRSRPAPVSFEQSQKFVLSAYAREAMDSKWSHSATQQLHSIVDRSLPKGSRVLNLECRTTLCLVEMSYVDARAASAFALEGFGGWPGSILVASESQGRDGTTVTYLASREGTEPPLTGDVD